jgi:hypothetical protein
VPDALDLLAALDVICLPLLQGAPCEMELHQYRFEIDATLRDLRLAARRYPCLGCVTCDGFSVYFPMALSMTNVHDFDENNSLAW